MSMQRAVHGRNLRAWFARTFALSCLQKDSEGRFTKPLERGPGCKFDKVARTVGHPGEKTRDRPPYKPSLPDVHSDSETKVCSQMR